MPLHLEHRPAGLDDVAGNSKTVESLRSLLSRAKEKLPHAYLFTGPSGCGKTTLGRILAKELGCDLEWDYAEVDSADFRGIDTVREIRQNMRLMPRGDGDCRVWLIDECHKMTNDAQNALLKALEDTPPRVFFILCTTDPEKLISTIRGRCSQFSVETLDEMEMLRLLKGVCRAENKKISREVLDLIVRGADGHPRNALVALDQVIDMDPKDQEEAAERIELQETQVIDLCRALMNKKGWKKVREVLLKLKSEDPEKIRRAVLGYCNSILLKEDNPKAFVIMDAFREPFYNIGAPGLTMACYDALNGADDDDVPF